MIDDKLKKIANYLREAFVGVPTVQRYVAADNVRFVDIINTKHPDKVTFLGTIGCSNRTMKGQPASQLPYRVELITAVEEQYTELMAETLGFLTFCLDTDKCFYHPGVVIADAIPESPLTVMRHIYLCDPFLWENGLPSLKLNDYVMAFLYALPITEAEKEYHAKYGTEAFEKLLQNNGGIDYPNLNR